MKLAKASGTLGLLALATIASPFATAADPAGWYGGLSLGQSRAKIDDPRITAQLLGTGLTTTSIADDNRDIGYKLFAGYQFNRNFALEGGYFDLGKFGFTATTVPLGSLRGNIQIRGVNFDAVGILPMSEKFSAFARVGLSYAETRDSFSGTGAVTVSNPNPRKSDANIKYGVGVQYDFTESLGMRLEAERYRINDAVGTRGDIDLLSIGLIYRFGGKTPAPAPRAAVVAPIAAAAPAPVEQPAAAAPPPPVQVVALPPPPPPTPILVAVTFLADQLFEFDEDTITPSGRQSLDAFGKQLKGTTFEVITVTGHTDRIGTTAYNVELSTRRAEMVKSYLVASVGIPAGKIAARGAGESDPVTKTGECKAGQASADLIACLQPDRRVEVAVTGKK